MFDTAEYRRWQAAADDAHRAATVQRDAGGYNWACFLAEQAAQLALKGLLHGIGSGGWGHDLVALGSRLAEALNTTPDEAVSNALRRLSRHYIPARYPDAHPAAHPAVFYGAVDADQALDDLGVVRGMVDAAWSRLHSGQAGDRP